MKFVDLTYKRITVSRKLKAQAIVRMELRDGMRWRRNRDEAAVIQAERMIERNNGASNGS